MGRLRYNQQAEILIAQSPYFIHECCQIKYRKKNVCEIGGGKGEFIINYGLQNPHANCFFIEKHATLINVAIKKGIKNQITNVFFLKINALNLSQWFKKKIDQIFLNFSDPWPKKRHILRRLTSPIFLQQYMQVLKKNGIIELKTDNPIFFTYSCQQFSKTPFFLIEHHSTNLYAEQKLVSINIKTEYEKKFIQQNKVIYFLRVKYLGKKII